VHAEYFSNVTTENTILAFEVAIKKHGDKYDYSNVKYIGVYDPVEIICPIHGSFYQRPNYHLNGHGCQKCANQYSTQHEIIKQFLIDNNINFEENTRQIISPLELDFYIPEHNLAIEVNGLYWHSEENGKDQNYHINKTKLCQEQNISLIHIFEDEFKDWENVKLKLHNIINNKESFEDKNLTLDINWNPVCPDGYTIKEIALPNLYYTNTYKRISEQEYLQLEDQTGWFKIWDCGSMIVEKIDT
jgi:very-short-patch-repair endonuclease